MPITVDWANDERTVLLIEHVGHWTWDEVFAVRDDDWSNRLQQAEQTVHLIFDYTKDVDPPTNFSEVMIDLGAYQFPENTGLLINVGLRGINKIGSELFSQIYHKVHQVERLEDAFALIKVYDERRRAGVEQS